MQDSWFYSVIPVDVRSDNNIMILVNQSKTGAIWKGISIEEPHPLLTLVHNLLANTFLGNIYDEGHMLP